MRIGDFKVLIRSYFLKTVFILKYKEDKEIKINLFGSLLRKIQKNTFKKKINKFHGTIKLKFLSSQNLLSRKEQFSIQKLNFQISWFTYLYE